MTSSDRLINIHYVSVVLRTGNIVRLFTRIVAVSYLSAFKLPLKYLMLQVSNHITVKASEDSGLSFQVLAISNRNYQTFMQILENCCIHIASTIALKPPPPPPPPHTHTHTQRKKCCYHCAETLKSRKL